MSFSNKPRPGLEPEPAASAVASLCSSRARISLNVLAPPPPLERRGDPDNEGEAGWSLPMRPLLGLMAPDVREGKTRALVAKSRMSENLRLVVGPLGESEGGEWPPCLSAAHKRSLAETSLRVAVSNCFVSEATDFLAASSWTKLVGWLIGW